MSKAKKKTMKKTEKSTSSQTAPETVPEPKEGLCLSGEQLKTLDLFEARVTMQHVVKENIELRSEAISVDYRNKMATLKAQKRSTNDSLQLISQEHNAFVAQLEKEFDIQLKDYSIEPDGYLTFNPLPKEPPKEPVE